MARNERVAQAIKEEIGDILQRHISDPRIGFVTIIRAELTPDLKYAKIYFSVLGNNKIVQEAQKGIESAKGFIRKLLGERLDLRCVPDLTFKFDKSIEYSVDIAQKMEKFREENGLRSSSDTRVRSKRKKGRAR